MKNDFYKGQNLNKGALLREPQAKLSVLSPVTGENIPLTEIRIPSEKVMESIYKLRSNKRSLKLLNKVAVCDILPEIIKDKRNTKPVIAVKDSEGKYEIIEGLRRSFAVSLAPGAELVIHYANSMTEEEKKLLAKRADTYKAPSIIDLGQSLLELENELGDEFSVRKASEEFGVALSRISVAHRTAKIPSQFYQIFPDIAYVSFSFLSEIVKGDVTPELINKVISEFEPFDEQNLDLNSDEVVDVVKQKTSDIEKSVLAFVRKAINTAKKVGVSAKKKQTEWSQAQLPAGVSAVMSGKLLKLSISQEFLTTEAGIKLKHLLLSNENA